MDNRSAGRFATRQLGLEQDTPNPRAEERAFNMSSKRAALAFVGPILFLFFLFTAWGDLSFALWGRDVEGHLVDWVAVKHTGAPDGVNAQVAHPRRGGQGDRPPAGVPLGFSGSGRSQGPGALPTPRADGVARRGRETRRRK